MAIPRPWAIRPSRRWVRRPATSAGPNFTPPFPAYPSGHAGFGGALFQILRRFYGTDGIAFTFVSDEFNGETRDNDGNVRPLIPRLQLLLLAEEENGQSRIYLGIHWASTSAKVWSRDAVWPTTSSIMRSCRHLDPSPLRSVRTGRRRPPASTCRDIALPLLLPSRFLNAAPTNRP